MNPTKQLVSSATTLTVALLATLLLGPLTDGVEGVKCYIDKDRPNLTTLTPVETNYLLVKKQISTKDDVIVREKLDKSDAVIIHDEKRDTTTATTASMAFTANSCLIYTLRCTAALQKYQKDFFSTPSLDTSKYKPQICTDEEVKNNAVWQTSYGAFSQGCSQILAAYEDIDPDSFTAVMNGKMSCCASDFCNAPPGAPTSGALRRDSQLLLPLLLAAGAVILGLTI